VKVASIVEFIRSRGTKDEQPNECGNTVYRLFMPGQRYTVDFAEDFKAEGWQQFDTDQDAHYFGVWVNRPKRMTLTYAEGDWTLVECPTIETYRAEIEDACRFYGEGFICKAVDTDTRAVTTYVQDRVKLFLEPEGDANAGA